MNRDQWQQKRRNNAAAIEFKQVFLDAIRSGSRSANHQSMSVDQLLGRQRSLPMAAAGARSTAQYSTSFSDFPVINSRGQVTGTRIHTAV